MIRQAELSACGKYRWWLMREWKDGDGREVCFIMLNPSTADAYADDPTIRRCISFAKAWGYSSLLVLNLFALRATSPKKLLTDDNPIGKKNDRWLEECSGCDLVVAAWGSKVPFERDYDVLELLSEEGVELHCLGVCKNGKPKHPLYCAADLKPVPYKRAK